MIFGSVPIGQAIGVILAHSYQSTSGRIRKGQILSEAHVAMLRDDGLTDIIGVRLSDDDEHEDVAACSIAYALAGLNIRLGAATTGRVNLHATVPGLLMFNAEDIHSVNAADECITVATLLPDTRVVAGQILATIKIIPYGVAKSALATALNAISVGISVQALRSRSAALIQTRLPSLKESTLEKTRRVTENRLLQRQSTLLCELRPAHAIDETTKALLDVQLQNPDWILIFGASAISDRNDTIPRAIVMAGGFVERFGMPMDPGNLLLLGQLGESVVVGMPGCARSSRHNGLDKVLDRLACGVAVNKTWIARLGVGGLLKEVVDRPRPRVIAEEKPVVSALLLAAGSSSRFGEHNKLLAEWQGEKLIHHALRSIAASCVATITVVTGHEHEPMMLMRREWQVRSFVGFPH